MPRLPHLTTRALLLLTLGVTLVIAALWSGAGADGWRWLLVTALLLLTLEAVQTRALPLTCERLVPERAFLGRRTTWGISFRNGATVPVTARVLLMPPAAMRGASHIEDLVLVPGEHVTAYSESVAARLGVLEWPAVTLRLRGRLGLAWWERVVALPAQTAVVPDTLTPRHRRGSGTRDGERAARARGHGMELHALRDYLPGDPLRAIDWKASARSGRPCVRLLNDDQHMEILILLDCSRRSALDAGALNRLGHAVNVAARLAETAVLNGDPVGLVCYADNVIETLRPASGVAALAQLREALARAQPRATEASLLQAAVSARRLLTRRALVVILAEPAPGDDGGQTLRALAHLAPPHVPLMATSIDEDVSARAAAAASHWRDPYDILAAGDILHAVDVQQARARRQGTEIVTTRADTLDRALIARYEQLRRRHRV